MRAINASLCWLVFATSILASYAIASPVHCPRAVGASLAESFGAESDGPRGLLFELRAAGASLIPLKIDQLELPADHAQAVRRYRAYKRAIDTLANGLNQDPRTAVDQFSAVFYGADGFDLPMAAQLFRSADVLIGYDDHPFVSWNQRRMGLGSPVSGKGHNNEGYVVFHTVDDIRFLGPQMVSNLLHSVPNARILGAWAIQFPSEPGRVHGWLSFDSGNGSQKRHLIQIQASASRRDFLKRPSLWDDNPLVEWSTQFLSQTRFAYVLKGSMHFEATSLSDLIMEAVHAADGAIFSFDGIIPDHPKLQRMGRRWVGLGYNGSLNVFRRRSATPAESP